MRNRISLSIVSLVLLLASCGTQQASTDQPDVPSTTGLLRTAELSIERDGDELAAFTVEVAETPKIRARGLQGRQSLDDGTGMLFKFKGEGKQQFWNKDVLFPIDMIFADGHGTVFEIAQNVPPCTDTNETPCPLFGTRDNIMYVLEVNAGVSEELGITEGDLFISEEILK